MNPYPNENYVNPASAITTIAAPTAPASTSLFKMQGLGGLITPQKAGGNVLAVIQATLTDAATTVGEGVILQLYYGPITAAAGAPANADAVPAAAVAVGSTMEWATGVTLTTAALSFAPITLLGLAKGLTPGVTYWFDVAAKSVVGASQVALTAVTEILVEVG